MRASSTCKSQLVLHRAVGGLGLEGAFHVPDGGVGVALILADDAHANVGDEVIRHRGEHALEDIAGFAVALGFQVGFAQQAVGIHMFGQFAQDMAAVGQGLFNLAAINHLVDAI